MEDKEKDFGAVTLKDYRKFLGFSAGIPGFSIFFLVSIMVAVL
jgi:hypothetical protein